MNLYKKYLSLRLPREKTEDSVIITAGENVTNINKRKLPAHLPGAYYGLINYSSSSIASSKIPLAVLVKGVSIQSGLAPLSFTM